MGNLPKVSECPLRDNELKICMCQSMKCEDVDLRPCFGMRNAFQYGYAIAERRYLEEFKELSEEMVKRIQRLQNDND